MGRYTYRWWDGSEWTPHVADPGAEVLSDPLSSAGGPVAESTRDWVAATPARLAGAPRAGAEARQLLAAAKAVRNQAADCALAPTARRRAARLAFEAVRDQLVREELASIPLARLKETTEGRVRFGAIEAAGFTTVGRAASAGVVGLERIHGVGRESATKVIAAARQLVSALRETVRVRFDPIGRPPGHADLLGALWAVDVARSAVGAIEGRLNQLVTDVDAMMIAASPGASRFRSIFTSRVNREETLQALTSLAARLAVPSQDGLLEALAAAVEHLDRSVPSSLELWRDYERRAAFYNGLLIEVGELAPDLAATQGFLPAEVAERVQEHPLDTSMLRDVSLPATRRLAQSSRCASGERCWATRWVSARRWKPLPRSVT